MYMQQTQSKVGLIPPVIIATVGTVVSGNVTASVLSGVLDQERYVGTIGTIIQGKLTASISGGILDQARHVGTIGTIQAGNITASISAGIIDQARYIGTIATILSPIPVTVTSIATVGTVVQGKLTASISSGILDLARYVGTIDVIGSLQTSGTLPVVLDTTAVNTIRWGRNVSPIWIHAAEKTSPIAGGTLLLKVVSSGKSGYIYGFFISAGEANNFKINWVSGGSGYSIRIPFGGLGAVQYADFVAMNEGAPADGSSTITVTNVSAGQAGVYYQARLLYAEI
jgi:hypothetical protein